MKRIKKLILVTTSIFSVTAASHTFAVASLPKGIYVSGDIGLTRATGYGSSTFPSNTTNTTTGKAWGGGLGYKFNPYLGIQADYTRYADTRIKSPATVTAARDSHYSVDVTSLITFPIYDTGAELYGKLGIGWISAKIHKIDPTQAATYNLVFNTGTKSSTGLYWGLGAQYYFNQTIAAHIQYAQVQGNSSTANLAMYSLGLSMLFQT